MAYKNLLELLRERDRKSSPLPGNDYDLAADLTTGIPKTLNILAVPGTPGTSGDS